jgi:hypothetical protein
MAGEWFFCPQEAILSHRSQYPLKLARCHSLGPPLSPRVDGVNGMDIAPLTIRGMAVLCRRAAARGD